MVNTGLFSRDLFEIHKLVMPTFNTCNVGDRKKTKTSKTIPPLGIKLET